MKKAIVMSAAAALLVCGVIIVMAQKGMDGGFRPFGQGPGGHRGHGGPGGIGMALRGLDLNEEQKAKVKEIMDASRSIVEPIMKQLHDNHEKLEELGTAGKFDQAAVEAIAAEQGSLTAKLIVEQERTRSQVFAILTDEQKAKAAAQKQEFEQRMKDRVRNGDRPVPPPMDN